MKVLSEIENLAIRVAAYPSFPERPWSLVEMNMQLGLEATNHAVLDAKGREICWISSTRRGLTEGIIAPMLRLALAASADPGVFRTLREALKAAIDVLSDIGADGAILCRGPHDDPIERASNALYLAESALELCFDEEAPR